MEVVGEGPPPGKEPRVHHDRPPALHRHDGTLDVQRRRQGHRRLRHRPRRLLRARQALLAAGPGDDLMAAKIAGDQLATLRAGVAPLDTPDNRAAYREGRFARADRTPDVDMRYRWDLYWASR